MLRTFLLRKKPGAALSTLMLLASLLLAGACERQAAPLRVGVVLSLTGRSADVGLAARNGVMLAVEELNAAGGIGGRKIELVIRDLANDPQQARQAVRELVEAGVPVAIGPALSSMAVAMVPEADAGGMLLVAPTVSTELLGGKDDLFLRVYPQCRNTASSLAEEISRRDLRRIVIVAEQRNKAFTESWAECFTAKFSTLGGEVVANVGFVAGEGTGFYQLSEEVAASRPDGVLILASAIDTAMIVQQIAKSGRELPVFASEWSFTHDLLAHGGRAVEGLSLFHTFNENSRQPQFLAFVEAYRQRFGQSPSFPAVHGYDAMRLVLEAMQRGGRTAQELKREILGMESFQALQTELHLDRYGDVSRELYHTKVQGGRFVVVDESVE